MTSADRIRSRYEEALQVALNAAPGSASISDTFAAYLLALDLIAGEERDQKAGYSPANALLAVMEVFGTGVGPRVAEMLGVPYNVPGKTFVSPRVADGTTSLTERIGRSSSDGGPDDHR